MSEQAAYLLKFNRERIEQAYLVCRRRGRQRPVIAIFDLIDENARGAAISVAGEKRVEVALQAASAEVWPVIAYDFEYEEALRFLVNFGVDGDKTLGPLPSDRLPVLIATEGTLVLKTIDVPDDGDSSRDSA